MTYVLHHSCAVILLEDTSKKARNAKVKESGTACPFCRRPLQKSDKVADVTDEEMT